MKMNIISSLLATLVIGQVSGQVVTVNAQITMANFFFNVAGLGLSPERLSARCPEAYAEIETCIAAKCPDYHSLCAKPVDFVPPPERIGQEEPLSCGMLHDGFCSEFAPTSNCCLSTECGKPIMDAVTCLSKELHGLDRSSCAVPTDCSRGGGAPAAAAVTPAVPAAPANPATTTTTEGEAAAPLTEVLEEGDAITISRTEYNSLLNDMAVLTDILKDMEIRLMKLAPQVPAS